MMNVCTVTIWEYLQIQAVLGYYVSFYGKIHQSVDLRARVVILIEHPGRETERSIHALNVLFQTHLSTVDRIENVTLTG